MTKNEALELALEALENSVDLVREDAYNAEKLYGNYPSRQGKVAGLKVLADDHEKAITAIKQALALDKKAENTMIYRTFEQWKSGNVLEHGVPRTEHYSEDQLDLVEMGWNYGYDAGRAVEQALDKKAENARELGLTYDQNQE
jgi:tetratricopeptide (TPR) repeat protein